MLIVRFVNASWECKFTVNFFGSWILKVNQTDSLVNEALLPLGIVNWWRNPVFIVEKLFTAFTLQILVLLQVVLTVNQVERLDDSVLLINKQAVGRAEIIPFFAGANCKISRI